MKQIKRTKMKYEWFNINEEEKLKWEKLCQPGEYQTAHPFVLSGLLPEKLINQYTSVLVIGSATNDGIIYYMANGNRVDNRGSAIDQMPFGLAFVGNESVGSACLIQHGDWEGRTFEPPKEFWDHIKECGQNNVFPLSEMPVKTAGKLSDIIIDCQHQVFGKIFEVLREKFLLK